MIGSQIRVCAPSLFVFPRSRRFGHMRRHLFYVHIYFFSHESMVSFFIFFHGALLNNQNHLNQLNNMVYIKIAFFFQYKVVLRPGCGK
ncbi:hypothetical protein BCR42DRAFT_408423 [Absidia repens]|uniref:Uncharacterized protein n=1 Tax=Absidia repens TaxID=90262 RepID=A0A1X2IPT2_9FUNG|nr:hypothetical protein BCR42DRAFT_408423 [Absidia repens]